MSDPTTPVLGLAVIDSLNPSALAMTLWLMSRPAAVPRVLAYVAGIAATYFVLGVALMLGLGTALRVFGDALNHPLVLAVQLAIGLSLLLYGIFAPKAGVEPAAPREPRIAGLAGMAVLGVTVTTVELVTAMPYFAATALMTSARLSSLQWLPLLAIYNAIFIAPPLLLLGVHVALGRRLGDRYAQWRATLQRGAREAMLWIVAIAGFALSGDAIGRYLAKRDQPAPTAAATSTQVTAPRYRPSARPTRSPALALVDKYNSDSGSKVSSP